MRVIAGTARGRKLSAVAGDTTRPITDRAKEALFSILGPEIADAALLDLFAGTGSVGIEALSRGAASCTFVENNSTALDTIRRNLDHTALADHARIVRADVFQFLTRPATPYDILYVAPPQYKGSARRVIEQLDASSDWIAPGGVVIAQIHPREEEALPLQRLVVTDKRKYGSVLLLFHRVRGSTSSP